MKPWTVYCGGVELGRVLARSEEDALKLARQYWRYAPDQFTVKPWTKGLIQ